MKKMLTIVAAALMCAVAVRAQEAPCAAVQLPYYHNFNSDQLWFLPQCWRSDCDSGLYATGCAYVGAAPSAYGGRALFLAGAAGWSRWVATPAMEAPTGALEVDFAVGFTGVGDGGRISVGLMRDSAEWDSTSALATYTIGADGRKDCHLYVAVPDSGLWRLWFAMEEGAYGYVDDLWIQEGGTCPRPTGLALDWADSVSASLVWDADGGAEGWLVRVGSGQPFVVDTAWCLLSGLAADTAMHVEVRALCPSGDTTEPAVIDFRTACGVRRMPLAEGFDTCRDDELPRCWTAVGAWSAGGGYSPSMAGSVEAGSVWVRLSGRASADTVGLLTPPLAPTDSTVRVRFRLRLSGNGTFVAGFRQNQRTDLMPMLTVSSAGGDYAGGSDWAEYEFYSDTLGNVSLQEPFCVSFVWIGGAAAELDDVEVTAVGPCHAPTRAWVDSAWADTVALGWDDYSLVSAGYEVRYGRSADLAEAGQTVATLFTNVRVGGLDGSSTYHFWVRSLCPDDSARWLYAGQGSTACGPTGVPYRQSFDDVPTWIMPCWTVTGDNHQGSECSVYSFGDGKVLYIHAYGDTLTAASPLLRAPADELFVSFDILNKGGTPVEVGMADDTLGVFYPLASVSDAVGGSRFEFYTDQLPLSDTMRLAFRATSDNSLAMSYVVIDNLVVIHQRCRTPMGVTVDSVEFDMAYLHIVDPSDVGFYRVRVDCGDTSIAMDVADTLVTLTGLWPGYDHTVTVAAICYDGSLTPEVSTTFLTYCSLIPHIELPYSEDFAQLASPATNPDLGCWTMIRSGSDYMVPAVGGDSNTWLSMNLYGNGSRVLAALPGVDMVADLMLGFDLMNISAGGLLIEVGTMWHPDDDQTFVPLDTVVCPATGQWLHYELPLGDAPAGAHWVAFRVTSQGVVSGLRVDNVWLGVVPTCSGSVGGLAVDNVWSYSAELRWQVSEARNEGVSYTVHIATADGEPAGDYFVDTTACTILNLVPLTSYGVWVEMHCGGDVQAVSDTLRFTTRCDNAQTIEQSAVSNHAVLNASSVLPLNATATYSASQQVIRASELGELPSTLTAVEFNWCTDQAALEVVNCKVYLAPYDSDTIDAWHTEGRTEVYDGPATFAAYGWNPIYFTTPYEYGGVGNLLLTVVAEVKRVANVQTMGGYDTDYGTAMFYYSNLAPFGDDSTVYVRYGRGDVRFQICPGDVPTCTAPTLLGVAASADNIHMTYDAGGDMCQTSISEGWVWHGDVHSVDNSGSYSFDGLTPQTNYIVGVRRICPGMTSYWATRVIGTTAISCVQPSAPVVEGVTAADATVAFASNGSDNWQLHLFNSRVDTIIDLADTVYHIEGLVPDLEYHVCVRSRCGIEMSLESEWTDTVSFTTDYCHPVATATVVADGPTAAVVSWTDTVGADHYRVEYGLRGYVRSEALGSYGTTGSTQRIEGLEPGQFYDFYVAAVCQDSTFSVWTYAGGVPPLGVGGAQNAEPRLAMQPNPAHGSVGLTTAEAASVVFYDIEGRAVLRCQTGAGRTVVDISALGAGTYFVRATSAGGSSVGKLVVR